METNAAQPGAMGQVANGVKHEEPCPQSSANDGRSDASPKQPLAVPPSNALCPAPSFQTLAQLPIVAAAAVAGSTAGVPSIPATATPSATASAAPETIPSQAAVAPTTASSQQQQAIWQQALQTVAGGATFMMNGQQLPTALPQQSYLAPSIDAASLPAAVQALYQQQQPTVQQQSSVASPSPPRKRKAATATMEPSVVSSTSSNNLFCPNSGPPVPKKEAEIEKMTPAERRRYERNLREQQRSYKISQQIKQLRDVLAESNVPFHPNKFSILVSVVDYIKQLQARAIMLDVEHDKLIKTIKETNNLGSTDQAPASSEASSSDVLGRLSPRGSSTTSSENKDLLMVQGIDYCGVFEHCPFPLGVASLDGRILACNGAFESLLACDKAEILQQSLFMYIRNHQEIFEAMADLLKRSSIASEAGEGTVKKQKLLFWCGHITSSQNEKLPFNITLTSTADGNPKYFSFSASGAAAQE